MCQRTACPLPRMPYQLNLDSEEQALITAKVTEFLLLGITELVPESERGQGVYSSIFTVAKKGGSRRLCTNLKPFNRCVQYLHFKMEGMHTVKDLIRRGDWMSVVGITKAYPHVPLSPRLKRCCRFMWNDQHFQYVGLPFGLCPAPRLFTKLMRPVVQQLRSEGIRCVIFIDDILVISLSCEENICDTQWLVDLLHNLGFAISPKSQVVPFQSEVEFLGFLVSSLDLSLRLPGRKIRSLRASVKHLVHCHAKQKPVSIRQLSSLLGQLQAASDAIFVERLYTANLRRLKLAALHRAADSYDSLTFVSKEVAQDMMFWATHLDAWNGRGMFRGIPDHLIETDASHYGWGASLYVGNQVFDTRGFFTPANAAKSSNNRELRTVGLAVRAFASVHNWTNVTIHIRSDNSATVSYINKMSGRDPELSKLAEDLWKWALARGIALECSHIPGIVNVRSDRLSRWKTDFTD